MDQSTKVEWWHRIKSCPACGTGIPATANYSETYWNEDRSISIWYYTTCPSCGKTWMVNDEYRLDELGTIFEKTGGK